MFNAMEVQVEGSIKVPEPESPSGSTKAAACVQRSVPKQESPEPFLCCLRAGAINVQPTEDVAGRVRESDPLIVVEDGNTVHEAKGRAEEQRQHRTDAATRRSYQSA